MNNALLAGVIAVLVIGASVGAYAIGTSNVTTVTKTQTSTVTSTSTSVSTSLSTSTTFTPGGPKIQVVAGENFWGSLVSQLGGTQVNVTSIVSDPNADPHEYESNVANAKAIATAGLVIVNGAGYDDWAIRLIAASNTPGQKVLNVQNTIGLAGQADLNPHFWYSPYYVNDTVKAMYKDLVAMQPSNTPYFHQQYANLNVSLWQSYMSREASIKHQYSGAPVASTESIFVYMANATGLTVVSPPAFMAAVAEGNDPSAQDIATFQKLMQGGNSTVNVLVYNEQTVTPLTQSIKALAAQNQIPTIGVTETIQPQDVTFQIWMGSELIALQNALNAQALSQ